MLTDLKAFFYDSAVFRAVAGRMWSQLRGLFAGLAVMAAQGRIGIPEDLAKQYWWITPVVAYAIAQMKAGDKSVSLAHSWEVAPPDDRARFIEQIRGQLEFERHAAPAPS